MITVNSIFNLIQNRPNKDKLLEKPFLIVTLNGSYSNFTLSLTDEDKNNVKLFINQMNNDKVLTLAEVIETLKTYDKNTLIDFNDIEVPTGFTYSLISDFCLNETNEFAFAIMIHKDLLSKIQKQPRLNTRHITMPLMCLEKFLNHKDYPFDLNPVFQRGNVWTLKQKIAFVENFIKNPQSVNKNIYFNDGWLFNKLDKTNHNDMIAEKYVCLDGLQRLTAICDFMEGKFAIFGDIYWQELIQSPQYHKILADCDLDIYDTMFKTNVEVLNFYLDFNSTGVKHSDEEIQRVKKLLEQSM